MSQKSPVPQAVSFVSQVLKRDTPTYSVLLTFARSLCVARRATFVCATLLMASTMYARMATQIA